MKIKLSELKRIIKEESTASTRDDRKRNARPIEVEQDSEEWNLVINAIDRGFMHDVFVYNSDSDAVRHVTYWLSTASEQGTNVVILRDPDEDSIYGWFENSLDDLLARANAR